MSLEASLEWMKWVVRWALPSGVLAEQLHPETGEPMGVSPLAWSHAEVVAALVEYLEKRCRTHSIVRNPHPSDEF